MLRVSCVLRVSCAACCCVVCKVLTHTRRTVLVCFSVDELLRCDPFDADALSALSHASSASHEQLCLAEGMRVWARRAIARGRFVVLTGGARLVIYDWISGSVVREHRRCGAASAQISPDGRALCYTDEDDDGAGLATSVYA